MFSIIKTPAVCLCIVLYLLYFFRQNKRLATEGAKCYKGMIWCAVLNLAADMFLEYYTGLGEPRYKTDIAFLLNLVLISVATMPILLYWYVITYIEAVRAKRSLPEKLFLLVLWVAAAVLIIISPVTYRQSRHGGYSVGMKMYVTYGAVFVSAAGMLIHGFMQKKLLSGRQGKSLMHAFVIYMAATVIQIVIPYAKLMGLVQLMVLLMIILSMENPEHYLDSATGLFNMPAFERIMTEKTFSKRRSFTVLACALNNDEKNNREATDRAMEAASKYMMRHFRMQSYRLTESIIVFVEEGLIRPTGKVDAGEMPDFTEGFDKLRQHECLFSYPKDCTDYAGVMAKIDEFKMQNAGEEAFMDAMTGVFNRNRYEHDAPQFEKKRDKAWCLVVDINNLKVTNDKFGHEAGDDLIITVAHLLQDVFSGHGYVYRTGGDEFTIVYLGETAIEEKVAQLKEGCKRKNSRRSLPVRFAVGYAQYRAGKRPWQEVVKEADANMYEDKIKSKQKA